MTFALLGRSLVDIHWQPRARNVDRSSVRELLEITFNVNVILQKKITFIKNILIEAIGIF